MQHYFLALDLKNEPEMIVAYEDYHRKVWPEIIESIKQSGIVQMEIYRVANRLVMHILANDGFSLEHKNELDLKNTKVQEWENLMDKYQQSIPGGAAPEKWRLMHKIFEMNNLINE